LAKVARRDGQEFDFATWMHNARSLPKEEFKREVEKELTGRESEPWEIIYFKIYRTQIPVIEQAIETAALMLGTPRANCIWWRDCAKANRQGPSAPVQTSATALILLDADSCWLTGKQKSPRLRVAERLFRMQN